MNKTSLICTGVACLLSTFACNQRQKKENHTAADSLAATSSSHQQFCFIRVEGQQSQDTTRLSIELMGDSVKGQMAWIPAEKDARTGTIKGMKKGDLISGIWTFSQEGTKDSLPVEFKLAGDVLLQKEFSADPSTGRQFIEKGTPYSAKFTKTDCAEE